jgi:hypothetical protein
MTIFTRRDGPLNASGLGLDGAPAPSSPLIQHGERPHISATLSRGSGFDPCPLPTKACNLPCPHPVKATFRSHRAKRFGP